ncbi:MAG: hypothetical protein FWH41_03020 [Treponema sp.]|nr:hypothetical protein [Treponema sp.]
MDKVIGQRWEVYDYEKIINTVPKRGEIVLVCNTPDYADEIVLLKADGSKPVIELYAQENKLSKENFTFIIDSDEKLAAWAKDLPGYNYMHVLIKTGSWTYDMGILEGGSLSDPFTAIDISNGRTKSVTGEAGSKIIINYEAPYYSWAYCCGIKGSGDISYPSSSDIKKDYFFNNVNIEVNGGQGGSSIGLYLCRNLYACTGIVNGSGEIIGIYVCSNLINCIGTADGTKGETESGYIPCGIQSCYNLINCIGEAFNGQGGYRCYGFCECRNLTNCKGAAVRLGGAVFLNDIDFLNCRTGYGCQSNNPYTVSITFENCYMEMYSGETPWSNTAAGGYNRP